MIGALVVGALLILLDAFEVAIVDAADIAERVRGELAQRVLTEQARFDFDAGESVAVGGDDRDFLVGQSRAQGIDSKFFDSSISLKRLRSFAWIRSASPAVDRRIRSGTFDGVISSVNAE